VIWTLTNPTILRNVLNEYDVFIVVRCVELWRRYHVESVEFIVHPVRVELIQRVYTCCPGEPFPTLHFYLTFER